MFVFLGVLLILFFDLNLSGCLVGWYSTGWFAVFVMWGFVELRLVTLLSEIAWC